MTDIINNLTTSIDIKDVSIIPAMNSREIREQLSKGYYFSDWTD